MVVCSLGDMAAKSFFPSFFVKLFLEPSLQISLLHKFDLKLVELLEFEEKKGKNLTTRIIEQQLHTSQKMICLSIKS